MGIVKADLSMSLDGYVAAPGQSLEEPFGVGGARLMAWMQRAERPDFEANEVGAHLMGRNMFGPDRGELDPSWTGWWGEDPPYKAPVFVLTHHRRDPVPMKGGTTFHFVNDGIESALARARAAAGSKDVVIAGGAQTVNQYLAAGLVDELVLQIVPVTLGGGSRLLDGVGALDLEQLESVGKPGGTTHLRYRVRR